VGVQWKYNAQDCSLIEDLKPWKIQLVQYANIRGRSHLFDGLTEDRNILALHRLEVFDYANIIS
jgi:hypothetical protein